MYLYAFTKVADVVGWAAPARQAVHGRIAVLGEDIISEVAADHSCDARDQYLQRCPRRYLWNWQDYAPEVNDLL